MVGNKKIAFASLGLVLSILFLSLVSASVSFGGNDYEYSADYDAYVRTIYSGGYVSQNPQGAPGEHFSYEAYEILEDAGYSQVLSCHTVSGATGNCVAWNFRNVGVVSLDDFYVDNDGDGFSENEEDCDDTDYSVSPNATEVCDGIDNDCDGLVDEGGVCGGENDTTAPAKVSGLDAEVSESWIYWTWENPSDDDFSYNAIFFEGENVLNTTDEFYNATNLDEDTLYEIEIFSVDFAGNANEGEKDAARTLGDDDDDDDDEDDEDDEDDDDEDRKRSSKKSEKDFLGDERGEFYGVNYIGSRGFETNDSVVYLGGDVSVDEKVSVFWTWLIWILVVLIVLLILVLLVLFFNR